MRSLISSLAALVCMVIGIVLLKVFGPKVGFGFMIIAALAVVAVSGVLRELTKHSRETLRADIQRMLAGETMYEFLRKHPYRVLEMQNWKEGELSALLEALNADDARRVKELLTRGSDSE